MAFKLFGLGNKKAGAAGPGTVTATTVIDDGKTKGKGAAKPTGKPILTLHDLFGKGQNLNKRMQVMGAVLAVTMIAIGALIFRDSRDTAQAATYVGVTGELRLLTQQIGKAVARATQGNSTAFSQLKEGSAKFTNLLGVLANGGEIEGHGNVPASPDAVRIEIDALAKAWDQFTKDSAVLLDQEKTLTALSREAGGVSKKNAMLTQAVEQISGRST
jgi:twitching motility protein PilJ